MNNYLVTFTRSDGSVGQDKFTEPTESAARKAFKECYRHDVYTNVSVKLIDDDATDKGEGMPLEERVTQPEKEVAELKGQVSAQPTSTRKRSFEGYQERSKRLDEIADNILVLICEKDLTFGDAHHVLENVKTKLHGLKVNL